MDIVVNLKDCEETPEDMLQDELLHGQIINLPYKIGAVITGGGAGAITDLIKFGGMSSVLEELNVPYGVKANESFMNHVHLPSHCSEGAAILLAAAQSARLMRMGIKNPMAVACTASLYVEGQREGRVNQAWVCIVTDQAAYTTNIKFPDSFTRIQQEKALEENLRHWIAFHTTLPMFFEGAMVDFAWNYVPLQVSTSLPKEQMPMVFCGSFNPWHDGHSSALKLAHDRYPARSNIIIELSSINADKGLIGPDEIERRIRTIPLVCFEDDTGYPINTRIKVGTAATFIGKLNVYLNPLFIVGSDTMFRIGDKKYYRDYEAAMKKLAHGAEFLVMLRGHTEIEVKNNMPDYLYDKCVFAEHEFAHVSSSQIRNGN